jgi:hypothetical protein
MTRILTTAALAVALTAYAPMISAQAPAPGGAPAATPTVNLTVEQRHVIKELIKDMKIDKASGDMQLTVGGAVPTSVQKHSFPQEVFQKVPQVRNHEFFLKDTLVVVVNPRDNTIAEVIE